MYSQSFENIPLPFMDLNFHQRITHKQYETLHYMKILKEFVFQNSNRLIDHVIFFAISLSIAHF